MWSRVVIRAAPGIRSGVLSVRESKPPSSRVDPYLEVTQVGPGRIEVVTGTVTPVSSPRTIVEVGADAVLIGRHTECQVVLDDPRVSSVHAEMVGTEQGVRLKDLGSKNGTFLGGVRVGEVYFTMRTAFWLG